MVHVLRVFAPPLLLVPLRNPFSVLRAFVLQVPLNVHLHVQLESLCCVRTGSV
jgi:hypothetical protein